MTKPGRAHAGAPRCTRVQDVRHFCIVANALGLLLVFLLTGCVAEGGDGGVSDDQTGDADTGGDASASELAADLSGPPVLGPVVWSTAVQPCSNLPVAIVSSFADTAEAIYAVFPIERLPAGSTILAEWTYNDTSLDGMEATLTAPADQIGGWLEFHLERSSDDPWPDGKYAIQLTAGGVLLATGEVALTRGE